jgi:putative flippase GtrA
MQRLVLRLVTLLPPAYQNTAKQFIKFVITGAIGAIVDFGSYNLLTRGLDFDTIYIVLGYEVIAANLVSVFLAIISNFMLNRYWTFYSQEGDIIKQWTSYFTLNLITFILNQILTSFFAFRVPVIALLFGSQKDNAAKALSIGFILFVNFLGSKFLIFRKKPTPGTI